MFPFVTTHCVHDICFNVYYLKKLFISASSLCDVSFFNVSIISMVFSDRLIGDKEWYPHGSMCSLKHTRTHFVILYC